MKNRLNLIKNQSFCAKQKFKKNDAINDLIAPFLANQIAGFTSDFDMNMINVFLS